MEDAKFQRIASEGMDMLTALTSPLVGARGGEAIAYNAYLAGTEVVVVGYKFAENGHTYTKPVAVLVDEDLFGQLRVDDESGRTIRGASAPKKVL